MEEGGVVDRFGKKINGASLNCSNCHWNVAPRSDEDDRQRASLAFEFLLQFETRHTWHAYIRDQARGLIAGGGIQELLCGAEAERGQPLRLDQILESNLNRLVVVEDRENAWVVFHAHCEKSSAVHKTTQSDLSGHELRLRW